MEKAVPQYTLRAPGDNVNEYSERSHVSQPERRENPPQPCVLPLNLLYGLFPF